MIQKEASKKVIPHCHPRKSGKKDRHRPLEMPLVRASIFGDLYDSPSPVLARRWTPIDRGLLVGVEAQVHPPEMPLGAN